MQQPLKKFIDLPLTITRQSRYSSRLKFNALVYVTIQYHHYITTQMITLHASLHRQVSDKLPYSNPLNLKSFLTIRNPLNSTFV